MISSPSPEDERNHKPSDRKDWRESYYFNFVDLTNEVSGFTTIGLLPNTPKREFVFALFHDDKRYLYYKEHESAFSLEDFEPLNDGHLRFELVEALKSWRIALSFGELEAEIVWTARFAPFDFGPGSGKSWEGHFEQSGVVTGTIRVGGTVIILKGYGQRDKSWGPRDWHIDRWYALHAQFENFSIGLRCDTVEGKKIVSGGISSASGSTRISNIETQTNYGEDPSVPLGATTSIICQDGCDYRIHSRLISPSSFVKFTRRFPGGVTELFEAMAIHRWEGTGELGTGLLEWLSTSFH
jgi:hypothetical protein